MNCVDAGSEEQGPDCCCCCCQDFGEHGIAPSEISTSQEFTSSRRDATREKARAVNAQAALITGDTLLEELIAPTR